MSTIQPSDPNFEAFISRYTDGYNLIFNEDLPDGTFWVVGIGYMEGQAWVQHYIKSDAKSPDEGYKVTFEPATYVHEKIGQ